MNTKAIIISPRLRNASSILSGYLPEHVLEQEDGTLYALTPTGAFHIAQLHLNRPTLIAHRLVERQLQLARQELLALRQRLAELRREEEEVRRQEEDLGRT